MGFKIRDFNCTRCELPEDFEATTQDEEAPPCPKCGDSEYVVRGGPTAPGGYKMTGDNSASVTPKGSGSYRR